MARGQWTPVSRLIRCCIFSPSVRCNIRSACALRGKSAVGRGGNIQSIMISRPLLRVGNGDALAERLCSDAPL